MRSIHWDVTSPPCRLGISRWKGIKLLSDFPLYGEVLIVRSPDFMASVTTFFTVESGAICKSGLSERSAWLATLFVLKASVFVVESTLSTILVQVAILLVFRCVQVETEAKAKAGVASVWVALSVSHKCLVQLLGVLAASMSSSSSSRRSGLRLAFRTARG